VFSLADFKTEKIDLPEKELPCIEEAVIMIQESGPFNHEEIFLKAKQSFANKMEKIFKKEFLSRLSVMGVKDFQVRKALEHSSKKHPELLQDASEVRNEIKEVYGYYMKLTDRAFKIMHLIMDYYKTEMIDVKQLELEDIKAIDMYEEGEKEGIVTCDYLYITNPEELEEVIKPFFEKKVLGVDLETSGLDPHINQIRLIQIAAEGLPVLMIDMFKVPRENLKLLEELFTGPALKIFQNGKFDLKFLIRNGFKVNLPYFDTMLASQVLEAGEDSYKGKYKLDAIVKRYLKEELSKEMQNSKWDREILTPEQLMYAAKDSQILLRLYKILRNNLIVSGLEEAAGLEFNILPAVVEMELTGIYLDRDKMKKLSEKIEVDLEQAGEKLKAELLPALTSDLFGKVDINLNSQQQLLSILSRLGLNLPDTSEETLKKYVDKHSVIQAILDYRKPATAYDSFSIKKYEPLIHSITGRLHPQYFQTTSAGRFSCSKPNLQQVPRDFKFRECFKAEEGNVIVCSDYSQIELRTAAEIANDETMLTAYREGQDLHKLTAALVSGKSLEEVTKEERQMAKALNFGLIYGMSAKGLAVYAKNSYGVDMSEKEAEKFRNRFFKAYKGLNKWHMKTKRDRAYEVRTLSGRRRKWDKREDFYLTTRLNTPVQGSAADILKRAFTMLPEALKGTGAKIIGTVHDEILLECSAARAEEVAKILKETMEAAGRVYLKKVPVISDPEVGKSWAEAK